jgi:limonene-1,2-epoxide hydrolase
VQDAPPLPGRLSPGMRFMTHDSVREFVRAFNERDLNAFVSTLDPEVEMHAARGLRKGTEAARVWATRAPGGVQQTIEVEELFEDDTESGGGRALALIKRVWRWDEDGSHASTDEMAWMFELHDQKIRSWRPFDDREDAWRAYHGGDGHSSS